MTHIVLSYNKGTVENIISKDVLVFRHTKIMAKKAAKIFGIIFLLVGALGFVSNPIVGMGGMFHTNMMHNIVHLLIGLVLLLTAGTEAKAKLWLKIVGIVYLLVAVLGFMSLGDNTTANLLGLVEVNSADNWLHLVLGLILFILGMGGSKMQTPTMNSGSQM